MCVSLVLVLLRLRFLGVARAANIYIYVYIYSFKIFGRVVLDMTNSRKLLLLDCFEIVLRNVSAIDDSKGQTSSD